MTDIRVPTLGESVTEATIGRWFKKPGDVVEADEPLVELETDKVTIEVPAPSAGILSAIAAKDGETVPVGAVLGEITSSSAPSTAAKSAASNLAAAKSVPAAQPARAPAATQSSAPAPAAKAASSAVPSPPAPSPAAPLSTASPNGEMPLPPSVRRLGAESGVAPETVPGSGKDGRVTKGDMLAAIERAAATPMPVMQPAAAVQVRAPSPPDDAAREERVHMTRLRQTIARRLKDAQNTAAMLTTFNEVDMSAIIALRSRYRDLFERKHGVKLGFMALFVRAGVTALKEFPAVNAEIDGADIIYKNYYHLGIAVGTDKGLVVPVVRECDAKSLAAIEKEVADLGGRAREGRLRIEELQGGTFTITNGGIYGSLMSTPILNAPQSGILGMHKIVDRPIAIAGKVEVRPMMYLALSYDHRLVDGREAVSFLVRVKECLEEPDRLILDL